MSEPTTTSMTSIQRARVFLALSVLVTIALYFVPYGHLIGRPLMWLSTLAHELGHGVAAVLMGHEFRKFEMWANGSGVATWAGLPSRFDRAFISAGGLVGPALVAGLGFWLGREEKTSRGGLMFFGGVLTLALILVVRNLFGVVFVAAVAAALLAIAFKAKPWVSQVTVVFVAVQLALSVFSRGDYLFTDVANTSAGPMPSDVAQMADALFLPYWFWGALCGAFSVAVLLLGLRLFFKGVGGGAAGMKGSQASKASLAP
ncbi:MAG: M50 family metallopeptidase [Myxococcales bacterium]|nr:M50 family metallopeptidase [Myxococcales bacterium]